MITESLARSLTANELADRMTDEYQDPVVRELLRKLETEELVRESNKIENLESDLQEAESSARHWQEEAEQNEEALERLTKGINEALAKDTDRETLTQELRVLL